MATIRSPGIGSGLDINSLVQQLVAAERAPYATQITRQETKATLQISALGTLKGALSTFKSALDPLKTEGAFNPRTTTSGDTGVFTAIATSSAAVGTYEIEVVSL
ncbi:MAG TPA: flagellar cap protein FliD N-terminal domain-containing protein, partial [Steroidobacteraceae bacterium]